MHFLPIHRRNKAARSPRAGFFRARAFGIFGVFVISLSLLAPLQLSLAPSLKEHSSYIAIAPATAHAAAWESYAGKYKDFGSCYDATGDEAGCNNAFKGGKTGETAASAAAKNTGQCSWTANWNICFTNIIYAFTVGLGSALAYIASTILNTAVVLALDSTPYALQFITESWELVRDLANMAFLFILVYIAFTVMLKAETAGVMQTLAMVIVMAVLINFSFFLTRVVIDGGNILAVQFYNNIQPVPITNGSASQPSGASGGGITNGCLTALFKADLCKNARDLTAVIMNSIQIQNILGTNSFTSLTNDPNFGTAGAWVATLISLSLVYIVMGVMFFMLMGAFLYAAVLFITRIVTLWVLIIISPLAFAAEAIPAARFKGYYKEWQSMLISNTFYPAMFLFIFFVLSKLMASLGQSLGGTNLVNTGTSATFLNIIAGTVGIVVIKLGLVLGLLMVGLSFAKRVSTSMGEASQHLAGAVSGWAQGKVRGVAYGAAGLAGAGAAKTAGVANKYLGPGMWAGKLDDRLKKSRFGNTLIGYEARRYLTKPVAGMSIGGAESRTQLLDRQRKERIEKRANVRDIENREVVKRVTDTEKSLGGKTIDARLKELAADEAKETARLKELEGAAQANIMNLSPADNQEMKDLENKDKLRKEEVGKLETVKQETVPRIQNLSKREMEGLGAAQLANVAHLLSEGQRKQAESIEQFTESERDTITQNWHEKSAASPLGKSNAMVNELRKIDAHIQHLVPGERLSDHIGGHITLDAASIKKLSDKLGKKLDAAKGEYDTVRRNPRSTKEELAKASSVVRLAQQGVDTAKKLGETSKDVPGMQHANDNKPGVFVTPEAA